jgi:phosphate:Na+ symporter
MIETNLVEAGSQRLGLGLQISDTTQTYLQALHDEVFWAVERALLALQASDRNMAEQVMGAKLEINRLATRAENHIAQRLSADEPNRFDAFRIESEIVEYLKRVYYFAKRIAKVIAAANTVYKVVSEGGTGYRELELEPASEEAVSVAE